MNEKDNQERPLNNRFLFWGRHIQNVKLKSQQFTTFEKINNLMIQLIKSYSWIKYVMVQEPTEIVENQQLVSLYQLV